jgi:hypothetical protein
MGPSRNLSTGHNKIFSGVSDLESAFKSLDESKINAMPVKDLANIIKDVGNIKYGLSNGLFPVFEKHLLNCDLSSFDSQALSNIIWSYAKSDKCDSGLFHVFARSIC